MLSLGAKINLVKKCSDRLQSTLVTLINYTKQVYQFVLYRRGLMYQLIVGDLSTWSMRACICLELSGLPFEEKVVRLVPNTIMHMPHYSDSSLVPVLKLESVRIHDSLAIAEYINEVVHGKLLPEDEMQRAQCRSLYAEMHSGFMTLRTQCPFKLSGWVTPEPSERLTFEIQRLESLWDQAQTPFYFAEPTIADAFYAPMAYRLQCYGKTFSGQAGHYQKQLITWDLFQDILNKMRVWSS